MEMRVDDLHGNRPSMPKAVGPAFAARRGLSTMWTMPRTWDGNRPQPRGTALIGKSFLLLRQISRRAHTGWTLSELSAACGLRHPTAHRILAGLLAQGMVALRPGTRYYVLGPATLELAASAHPMFDLREPGTPALRRLVAMSGGTAYLSVRSGFDLVCIARQDPPRQIRALPMDVGARRPLCGSAGGVAMLLTLAPAERAAALRYGLAQQRSVGPKRRAQIVRMLRRSRELGFGLNHDLLVPGMTGIGVPIAMPAQEGLAAFTLTLPSDGLTERAIRGIAAEMRREAAALSASASPAP